MTDEEINRCQNNDQVCKGQICPDYIRCGEIILDKYAQQFGPEPLEEVEK